MLQGKNDFGELQLVPVVVGEELIVAQLVWVQGRLLVLVGAVVAVRMGEGVVEGCGLR